MTIAAVKALCSRIPWCEPAVLESSLELALEIAREGGLESGWATIKAVQPGEWVTVTSRHKPSTEDDAVVAVRPYGASTTE